MKNKALTAPKGAGYTNRNKRETASTTSNKGPWLKPHPVAAARLYEHVLYEHYDGDRQRLASGHGIFTKAVMMEVEAWFYREFPSICAEYRKNYKRKLNGGHMVRRVRFMFLRYTVKRKIDGVRSHEYRGVVPA
jgi:hypothetical protein